MRRTAEQVLRAHVIERMRRASVASRDMEASLTRVDESTHPRMGEDAWTESCRLTRGVDPRLWSVLTVYFTEWDEGAPARMAQEAMPPPRFSPGPGDSGAREWAEAGQPGDAVITRVCAAVSFQMACARVGMGYAEGRKLRYAALLQVAENIAGVKP